jgi:serine/threonine-protein phosphatase 2A regulatory subunit B
MRTNALCAQSAKTFDAPETPGSRSFFSEIIASVSDVKFSRDGGFLLSRDYLNLRLWDLRMENRPVATFEVHEHLRAKLCDLYESDAIFDKFQCCPGGDGTHVATGSYGNQFKSFDVATGATDAFEVTKDPQRLRRARQQSLKSGLPTVGTAGNSPRFGSSSPRSRRGRDDAETAVAALGQSAAPSQPEFNTKILHMAWHPTERVVACAASNSLYIFNA